MQRVHRATQDQKCKMPVRQEAGDQAGKPHLEELSGHHESSLQKRKLFETVGADEV